MMYRMQISNSMWGLGHVLVSKTGNVSHRLYSNLEILLIQEAHMQEPDKKELSEWNQSSWKYLDNTFGIKGWFYFSGITSNLST